MISQEIDECHYLAVLLVTQNTDTGQPVYIRTKKINHLIKKASLQFHPAMLQTFVLSSGGVPKMLIEAKYTVRRSYKMDFTLSLAYHSAKGIRSLVILTKTAQYLLESITNALCKINNIFSLVG
jgi:hypothetical protein